MRISFVALAFAFTAAFPGPAQSEALLLRFEQVPEHGLAVAEADLTAAAAWCDAGAVAPESIRAAAGSGATLQFVPGPDYDSRQRIRGVLVARLPGGGARDLRVEFGSAAEGARSGDREDLGALTVKAAGCEIVHDPAKQGGLPSRLTFLETGKALEALRWQDRLHDPKRGSFRIADDRQARVTRIAGGPLVTAIQVEARYAGSDGKPAESNPEAVYQWLYLHDQPLAYVTVRQRAPQGFTWKEAHFLECHASGDDLPRWAGGNPLQQGAFDGSDKSQRFSGWAALHDGRNGLALLRSGEMQVYDGKGRYGPYLHAHSSAAWKPWTGGERRFSAWLWIGSDADPLPRIARAAEHLPSQARVTAGVERVQARLEQACAELATAITGGAADADAQRRIRRQLAIAGRLQAQGRFQAALDAIGGKLPETFHLLPAGDLSLLLEQTPAGIRVLQLLDATTGIELLAPEPLPLFSLTLRAAGGKEDIEVTAGEGWRDAKIEHRDGGKVELSWRGANREGLEGLRVEAVAKLDAAAGAIRWDLHAAPPAGWMLRGVMFPKLAVADLGPAGDVLFPRGSGEVQRNLWQRAFRYSGRYPSGWTAMQWLAAYDAERRTGLYVGLHDPGAATKEIELESRPAASAVDFTFEHPPAGMNQAGQGFDLPGEAVWQVVRGDWFDAARIYRAWAKREARWWPALGPDGREDTPRWMRELPAWALVSGSPASVAPQLRKFAEALGVPVGVHWYNWHRIPFDNDYPHYFPTVDGFKEAVAELQRSPISIMPYINGRLWDTRDRGAEDFQFTSLARPAATKDEQGQPYLESYSSKEADGSRVQLAAMCPAAGLWRDKLHEIVGRLTRECGVKAVYLDQIAAAKPQLCFDPAHGHPTGGGDWWPAAYWEMLKRIRKDLPADRMLTTECNAEPYAHVLDGYLTWHWQYDGQVPAFPAVYGGALQMFGRAYRGGPTKDLALRMKAGEQLVFGEQIGWLSPSVVNEKENFEFFRQVVRLRWRLKRYFYAGEMARPPQPQGSIPRLTADWQWHGEWPVTASALQAGAWALPAEKRVVLLFVNVSDQPLRATCAFSADVYGLPGERFEAAEVFADRDGAKWTAERAFQRELHLPPRTACAWELTAK